MDGIEPVKLAAGTHLIIDLNGGQWLNDMDRVEAAMRRAVAASGARLLDLHLHHFSPQGITGVALLAESHITVHTWPEIGYAAFDAFMCGTADVNAVIDVFSQAFETENLTVRTIERGPS